MYSGQDNYVVFLYYDRQDYLVHIVLHLRERERAEKIRGICTKNIQELTNPLQPRVFVPHIWLKQGERLIVEENRELSNDLEQTDEVRKIIYERKQNKWISARRMFFKMDDESIYIIKSKIRNLFIHAKNKFLFPIIDTSCFTNALLRLVHR